MTTETNMRLRVEIGYHDAPVSGVVDYEYFAVGSNSDNNYQLSSKHSLCVVI